MLFTYILSFRGNSVPYLLEFLFCHCWVFFEIVNCKKIARQVCQEAILVIKHLRKAYYANNAIDEASINLSNFLLIVADSVLPKGMFCGLSSGT